MKLKTLFSKHVFGKKQDRGMGSQTDPWYAITLVKLLWLKYLACRIKTLNPKIFLHNFLGV